MNQVKDKSLQLTETLPGIIDFILSTPFTPEFQETPSPETEEIFYIPTATAFYIQEPPEEGIRVTLHARQNIWIRIYVDDELSYVGRLTGGEVKVSLLMPVSHWKPAIFLFLKSLFKAIKSSPFIEFLVVLPVFSSILMACKNCP